jgi:predicted nucleic acid-binding Zn ribbon protein
VKDDGTGRSEGRGRRAAATHSAGRTNDSGRRSSEPQRLADILAPALDRIAGSDQARAYGAWSRAAGDQVAGGARPRNYSRGVLTVECTSSVWANELTYLGTEILRRMDAVAPGHPVKRLRFLVASSPAAQESEAGATKEERRHTEPAPQDYGEARAQAEEVRDERLRTVIETVLAVPDEGPDAAPGDRPPRGSRK